MPGTPLTQAHLMRHSQWRLEHVARSGAPREQGLVARVLDCPALWVRWESEHAALMRRVATARQAARQAQALKAACFSLIHRKALFEHLRDQRITGRARQQLLLFFHRTRGYSQAMIGEHETYLRSSCSYLCSSYLGSAVIRDGVFQDPMRRYEELYSEYFRLFCEGALQTSESVRSAEALLPYLKFQIREQRQAILQMPRTTPSLLYDAALRQPTGDTAKLKVDALRADFST